MNTHDIDIELPSSDEAAAHMLPSDLKKFESGEHVAEAFSIAVGNPDETSQPLFTLDQVRAAVEADRKRRGEPVADENTTLRIAGCIFRHLNMSLDHSSVMAAANEIAGFTTPQPAVPVRGEPVAGYTMVPVEPTPQMIAAFRSGFQNELHKNDRRRTMSAEEAGLRAMLKATPQPAEPVKVPSDEDIIQLFVDMVQKDEIGGPVMDISMKEAIEVSRELLRRYGNTANPRPTDDELLDQALRERDAASEMADKLAYAIAKHLGVEIGEHSSANHPWYRALDAIEASQPVDHFADVRKMLPSDAEIREVFLANGFTIKPGHDDLKPYVYQAARALLARYGAQQNGDTQQ